MDVTIDSYLLLALGFLAQFLFGARILIQWWIAERSKHLVSPSIFWILSLAGSGLFLIYGVLRNDLVIVVGQLISYFIYIRNLQLKGVWNAIHERGRIALIAFPVLLPLYVFRVVSPATFDLTAPIFWLGLAGQLLLNLRFVYQWYLSEKSNESILPGGFWWLSLFGSMLVIVYSIFRKDVVLLLSQCLALVPYVRNIVISKSYGTK